MVDTINKENNMYIKEIRDYDEEAQEANVIVTDGAFEIMCYAQPFSGEKDINFTLLGFGVSDIMTAPNDEYLIEKIDGYYSYFVRGRLVDTREGIFQLGKLIIKGIDYAPKDIPNGAFVEFSVIRFDLLER